MYPDNSYRKIGDKLNSLPISDFLTQTSVVFYCGVYSYDKSKVVGILEHTILASNPEEGLTVSYIGDDNFKYDANGDIAKEISDKQKSLTVKLNWNNQAGINYSIRWLISGQEFIPGAAPVDIPSSMLKDVYVDLNQNVLYYKIRSKYRIEFTNNTLTLIIKTIDGKEYVYNKTILFLKDGDQGTNGTTYVTTIRPCDSNGIQAISLKALKYNSGSWSNAFPIRCYVYKDGEDISNNSNYNITYKWDFNKAVLGLYKTFVNHGNAGNVELNKDRDLRVPQVTVDGTGIIDLASARTETLERFIKIEVDIEDNSDENQRKTSIYATYPIDVILGSGNEEDFVLNNIPYYIKYTASGVNPQFANKDLWFEYQKEKYQTSDSMISLTPELFNVVEDPYSVGENQQFILKPIPKFIFKNKDTKSNIGILRCKVNDSLSLIHPIVMYLDAYGNENINGWDGTRLTIDEDKGYYLYAPQIGAGVKDSANRFRGVVMGVIDDEIKGRESTGLYGFKDGINTFGLKDDGTAFFGAAAGGGQIILDGQYAVIHGGDVTVDRSTGRIEPAKNGMYIVLADRSSSGTSQGAKGSTKAIGIGLNSDPTINKENFYVTYDGYMSAISGSIANWNIEPYRLYYEKSDKDEATHIELNAKVPQNETNKEDNAYYAFWVGKKKAQQAPFHIAKNGDFKAENAIISGEINANTGTIGGRNGWEISTGVIKDKNGYITLSTDTGLTMTKGSITLGKNFSVDKDGNLTAKNGTYSGEVESKSGNIGGWVINSTGLSNGTVSLNSGGSPLQINGSDGNPVFSISRGGNLTSTGNITSNGTLNASKGKIGAWNFNEKEISGPSFNVSTTGSMNLGNGAFIVDQDGASFDGKVTATEGTIGGWVITGNTIQDDENFPVTILENNGTITTQIINIGEKEFPFGSIEFKKGLNINNRPTDGIKIGNDSFYIIVTDSGVRMQAPNHSIVVTDSGCWADGSIIVTEGTSSSSDEGV